MKKRKLVLYLCILMIGCNSPNEGFKSSLIWQDSLLIIKRTTTDTLNLKDYKARNISAFFSIPDEHIIDNGEEYRSKMFFINNALYKPSELGKSVFYKMYFKPSALNDTTTQFEEVEAVNDTAYIRFATNENLADKTHINKNWSGKIIISLDGRDTTFLLQQEYRIKK